MGASWTINGVAFADLDLANVTRQRLNMATDRLTFTCVGRPVDAVPLFAYNAPVAVLRNGVPFFSGRADRSPRIGLARDESHTCAVLGPWDELERTMFQQRWLYKKIVDGKPVLRTAYKSRVVLGQGEDGKAVPVGAVIREAISYAQICGVSIAAGGIDDGPKIPWDETVDISCADVIRRVSRWCPDAMGWVDYSGDIPRFNWRRRWAAPSFTLPAAEIASIPQITELGRLSVPEVVLKYEQTVQLDSLSTTDVTIDAYPAGSQGHKVGAVVQTIQLSGTSVTNQVQTIKSVVLPEIGAFTIDWVKDHIPALKAPEIRDLVLVSVKRQSALTHELVEGTIQDWMRAGYDGAVYNLHAEDDDILCRVHYDVVQNGVTVRRVVAQEVHAGITATDAGSASYYRPTISTGEEVPDGLAAALYQALNARVFSGEVVLEDEEVSGVIHPGGRLSISGLSADWSDMAAAVQQVKENLDTGKTTITIGPADHLSPSDVLDLIRVNRNRKPSIYAGQRATGDAGKSGSIVIGSKHPRMDASASPEPFGDSVTNAIGLQVTDGKLQWRSQGQVVCRAGSTGSWVDLPLPAPAGVWVENLTGFRFDATSGCLQVKTQRQKVLEVESESAWINAEGGCAEDCDEASTGGG